jgi:Polyketide cyclase / dehydrase and lipid transport
MARYTTSVRSPKPAEEAFAYLSDFSTTAEWDPGVIEAERLSAGPLGEGSEFRVVAEFIGRRVPLTYIVTAYEPPRRIVLRGESSTVISLDEITVDRANGGALVTYDARLSLKGPLRVVDPLLGLAFRRTGDRAAAGIRGALGA